MKTDKPKAYSLSLIQIGAESDRVALDNYSLWTHTGLFSDKIEDLQAVISIMDIRYWKITGEKTTTFSDNVKVKCNESAIVRSKHVGKMRDAADAFNHKYRGTVNLADDGVFYVSTSFTPFDVGMNGSINRGGFLDSKLTITNMRAYKDTELETGKDVALELYNFTSEHRDRGYNKTYRVIRAKLEKVIKNAFGLEAAMNVDTMKRAIAAYIAIQADINDNPESPKKIQHENISVKFN